MTTPGHKQAASCVLWSLVLGRPIQHSESYSGSLVFTNLQHNSRRLCRHAPTRPDKPTHSPSQTMVQRKSSLTWPDFGLARPCPARLGLDYPAMLKTFQKSLKPCSGKINYLQLQTMQPRRKQHFHSVFFGGLVGSLLVPLLQLPAPPSPTLLCVCVCVLCACRHNKNKKKQGPRQL